MSILDEKLLVIPIPISILDKHANVGIYRPTNCPIPKLNILNVYVLTSC